MSEKFSSKKFDKWIMDEFQNELNNVPLYLRERLKTDSFINKMVYASMCHKLCFNLEDKKVKEAFDIAVKSLI